MTTVSSTFVAVGVSTALTVRKGQVISHALTGTFVGRIALQREVGGGGAWETVKEFRGTESSSFTAIDNGRYRWNCTVYTSGTVTYSLADSSDNTIKSWNDLNDNEVFSIKEDGIHATNAAFVSSVVSGKERFTGGSAVGVAVLEFGRTDGKGLQIKVIDETVDLTAAGAKYKAMTTPVPAGAVILSVQANIEALVVAGGTTVKVGLGPNAGTVAKYGKSASLVKNQKINIIPDWAVLAGDEAIDVCGVVTDGTTLGDTNISAGSVRVRVVYLQTVSLVDA